MSPELRHAFGEFIALVGKRLDRGAADYGDRSFGRSPCDLLGELGQEAVEQAERLPAAAEDRQ